MPLDRRQKPEEDEEDEERPEHFWRGLAWDLFIAAVIVMVFLVAMYAYAGVWPPLVVVESSSMQHSDHESFIGVIDTGDMVFQQAAPDRASVVTYLEGRSTSYATYGDYGDVIIFRRAGNPTPVIHRAILFMTIYTDGTADVPDLANPSFTDWQATNRTGLTTDPHHLMTLTIHHMGFDHDFGITFQFSNFLWFAPRSGYITMGDHNAALGCAANPDPCPSPGPYDIGWLPTQGDIIGRARGEIPWFGLLKLTLQPTESCCSEGWGDVAAPKNSWDSLLVSLIFLLALPFILEYAARGWTKYVAPRLPEIAWPWQRKAKAGADEGNPETLTNGASTDPEKRPKEPPKEESSEP